MSRRSKSRNSRAQKSNSKRSPGSSRPSHSAPSAASGRNPKPRAESGFKAGGVRRYRATVEKNRKGFAFLIFDTDAVEDAFVPPHEAERLFPGDRVEVVIGPGSNRGRGPNVINIKVVEHRFKEVVGYFSPAYSGGVLGHVIFEKRNSAEQIPVLVLKGLKTPPQGGDWVHAKLQFPASGRFHVTAEIAEVYGRSIPPHADIDIIRGEFGLIEEHTREAIEEAQRYGDTVDPRESAKRPDLRRLGLITIDGQDARDFDDAVFVERAPSGGWVLWVAIADVSYYVKPGTQLDRDAYARATSVYFPERAFHMLPRELSENLCSLKPNVDRLAMTARMEFDATGKRGKTEVMESVICSRRRATYEEIETEWQANRKNPDWEFTEHFRLYEVLRARRTERGSIDFDLPEVKVLAKPTGEVIGIERRERKDSHRLIEEFMIAANEAVTHWVMARKWPMIYRVHEEPSEKSLERFAELVGSVGISFDTAKGITSSRLAAVVRQAEGHPAQALINMSLLRAMKQAIYSATHGGHFGLSSDGYTHFTSPIRRYPDLLVHRLIRRILASMSEPASGPKPNFAELEKELTAQAEHCSYRERLSADAERESIKIKQIRVADANLGREFDAAITGMNEYGLFIQVADPYLEGFVAKDSLTDDQYEFNDERMVFAGRRKKRTFRIGDKVRAQVLRTDFLKRQIDLKLI